MSHTGQETEVPECACRQGSVLPRQGRIYQLVVFRRRADVLPVDRKRSPAVSLAGSRAGGKQALSLGATAWKRPSVCWIASPARPPTPTGGGCTTCTSPCS